MPSNIWLWHPSASHWERRFSAITLAPYSFVVPSGNSTSYTAVFMMGLSSYFPIQRPWLSKDLFITLAKCEASPCGSKTSQLINTSATELIVMGLPLASTASASGISSGLPSSSSGSKVTSLSISSTVQCHFSASVACFFP